MGGGGGGGGGGRSGSDRGDDHNADSDDHDDDHDHIDAAKELLKAMRLLPARIQEIERMVRPRQKAIEAHSAED